MRESGSYVNIGIKDEGVSNEYESVEGDLERLAIDPSSIFDCRTSSPIPTVIYHDI